MHSFETNGSKLVKYIGSGGIVEIPEGIKTVGAGCFQNCAYLEKVIIPDTVETIEAYAFANCANLREINLPYGLSSIGEYAFFDCVSLEGPVRFCYFLKTVGVYAFANCVKLRKININGAIDIGEGVFQGCVSLTELVVSERVTFSSHSAFQGCTGIPNYAGGFIISQEGVLSGYFGAEKKVTIPYGVRVIISNCFKNRADIEELYIPDTVVRIDDNAFMNCVNLRKIRIPGSLQSLGRDVFFGCNSMESDCVFPDRLLYELENYAFHGCPGLERSMLAIQMRNAASYRQYLHVNNTESVTYSRGSVWRGDNIFEIRKKANGIFCISEGSVFSVSAEEFESVLKTIFETVQVDNWRDRYEPAGHVFDGWKWELKIVRVGEPNIHCSGNNCTAPGQNVLEDCLKDLVERHRRKTNQRD